MSRRFRSRYLTLALCAALALGITGCATVSHTADAPSDETASAERALVTDPAVTATAEQIFTERQLRAAVGQVLADGEVIAEFALGEAMPGAPATIDASWRNGAVAIAYMSVAMLRLHERGELDIDAPIAQYLPNLPEADRMTPRQLITMTSGLPDYVPNPEFQSAFYADVFGAWTPEQLIELGIAQQRPFAPGENWDYSHTGIVVLGQVIERATGKPLAEVLSEEVLIPAGLTSTYSEQTAAIPAPFLHGFTAERGIYEDASFWNPSWTLAEGSVQTTTVPDAAASFDAIIGRGELLSADSHAALIAKDLVGFGAPLDGCRSCRTLDDRFAYGLGVFLRGDTVAQTPLFGGYSGAVVTLPASRASDGASLTVAVAVTLQEDAVADWQGRILNYADEIAIALLQQLRPGANVPDFAHPSA